MQKAFNDENNSKEIELIDRNQVELLRGWKIAGFLHLKCFNTFSLFLHPLNQFKTLQPVKKPFQNSCQNVLKIPSMIPALLKPQEQIEFSTRRNISTRFLFIFYTLQHCIS